MPLEPRQFFKLEFNLEIKSILENTTKNSDTCEYC